MKDDLRKLEVGGVSSHDLYVKREFHCREKEKILNAMGLMGIPPVFHMIYRHTR